LGIASTAIGHEEFAALAANAEASLVAACSAEDFRFGSAPDDPANGALADRLSAAYSVIERSQDHLHIDSRLHTWRGKRQVVECEGETQCTVFVPERTESPLPCPATCCK
jgi:hypothetical protein